jgi:hypothetical protein
MDRPPYVERGDWLQTKTWHSEITLRFYDAPPMNGQEIYWHHRPDFYIGPVHDVSRCANFLTVTVPHPCHPDLLVNCNVWTARGRHGRPMQFCKIVSHDHRYDHWHGWDNTFIE